jgi:molecular chaperone DnaK (HSP70)
MVKEAELSAADDKAAMEKVEAKNSLESYLYNSRNTFNDEKTKEKLSAEDVDKATNLIKEYIDWLDANPLGEKETYAEKQKEAENAIRPILMKLYGATDASVPPVEPVKEPVIEEVD